MTVYCNETGESKPKEPQQKHTQINLSALNMITVAIRGAEEWKGRDIKQRWQGTSY